MSYTNYRFSLSNDSVFDLEQNKEQVKKIFAETQELGFIRMAVDLTSHPKSISLLCQAANSSALRAKIKTLLLAMGITIGEEFDVESLEEEKETACSGHDHSHHHHHHHEHEHHHPDHAHENHWLKAGIGIVWGLGLLALSFVSFNIPLIAYYIITGLTAAMSLYLGRSVFQSAWNALRQKKWDTTTLYSVSTLTIIAVSIASLFVPGLPMMFEAAPLVLGFWHLGEGIEHTLLDKINSQLDVRDGVVPLVLLKDTNKNLSVKQLIPNDIIIVNPGQVLPVDGILLKPALLYTTHIDGSPYLKEFKPGDQVKSGMRLANHAQELELKVTKTYQRSYLSLIAQNIQKANNEKAPVEVFANKILKYFIPGLIGIALLSGLVIGLVFSPALAIQCVIAVLVSACPCALSLITPSVVKIGMNKAAEKGIHFNNGKALQAAADIDTVVFDLNGTLTKGLIEARDLQCEEPQYLSHFALLESQSAHPVAKIIKSYLNSKNPNIAVPLEVSSLDKSHHSGIKGVIDDELFMIGNKDMLAANGITKIPAPYENPQKGSIYLVRGTRIIGQLALNDPLREDAIAAVKELQRLGKTVHLCTGADKETAEEMATLLGIAKEHVCANTVGAVTKQGEISKTSYIDQLKRKGHKVSMVGDAANDATAIAYSDVGIAVKSCIGDEITQQQAGIVVQQGLLFPIASAFDTAKKAKTNIVQNLFISLTYNSLITLVGAGLFVALGFTLNPALGVALMVIESTIILANLYRFKKQNIVSSTLNSNETKEEPSVNTTAKILDTLGYHPQPKAAAEKSFSAMTSSRGFFLAYEKTTEPDELKLIEGDSFDPYLLDTDRTFASA